MWIRTIVLALALGVLWTATAQEAKAPPPSEPAAPTLTLGDRAPALDIATWHRGEAVSDLADGRVYVVEFWATWCGPCLQSIPHLSELQKTYGDQITIIGMTEEEASVVTPFLEDSTKPEMAYTVASDREGTTKKAFMDAFGAKGIPTAFIVGKTGHLEWVGHPTQMDKVLEAVVQDRFDSKLYATWSETHNARGPLLKAAMDEKRWDDALAIIDAQIADHEADTLGLFGSGHSHENQRFQILLAHLDRAEEAFVLGHALVDQHWDNASFLNNFAWFIVDEPGLPARDLELAMTASVRSNILSHGREAAYLDTLARVYFEQGKLDLAVRYQRDAVQYMKKTNPGIQEALDRYERVLNGKEPVQRDRTGRRRDAT